MENNIKGLYKGLDEERNHTYYFTLTRGELNEMIENDDSLLVDNNKDVYVSIDPSKLELISEDQDFIEKVDGYKMTTSYEL